MGWLIALAVVAGLAILPLGVSGRYDINGPRLWLLLGPARIRLIPSPKGRKEKGKTKSVQAQPQAKTKEEKQGGSLSDFLPLIDVVLKFLGEFRRKLRVNRLEIDIVMAEDDPCDLAEHYGQACAALASLEPQLERLFVIKKKRLHIGCDFTVSKTQVWGRLDLTVTLGRLLSLLIRHGCRGVGEFMKLKNRRKGGALK